VWVSGGRIYFSIFYALPRTDDIMAILMNGIENTLPVVGSKINREEAGDLKAATLKRQHGEWSAIQILYKNKTTCLATDGLYRF